MPLATTLFILTVPDAPAIQQLPVPLGAPVVGLISS